MYFADLINNNAAIRGKDDETESSSSTISTRDMQRIINKLRLQHIRDSTRKCYYSIWKTFNEFFVKLDEKPNNWEDRILLFIGYLISKNRKSQTIKSYLSAIRLVLREDGIELDEDLFLIKSLTKACKFHNDRVRIRLPIQKLVLRILLKTAEEYFLELGQVYLARLYAALFATAYYGLFRVSELTSGAHPVKAVDVHIAENKQKIMFILRSSKTHGTYAKPQIVKITSQPLLEKVRDQEFCPYAMLNRYIEVRPKYRSTAEPFFIFGDASPVTTTHANWRS